jgi:hypothetical protein
MITTPVSVSTPRRFAWALAALVASFAGFDVAAKTPAWVQSAPIDPDFYHGVGMASKRGPGSAAYRDLARHRALRNLAMEISTVVSSRFVLNTVETTGMSEEDVKSEILTHAEANLEGHEFVAAHETRTEYWEFYRYSKALCHADRERARVRAIAAAAGFIAEAQQAEKRREMVSALRLFCQALAALQNYFGEQPPEFVQAQAALERILSGMRLTCGRAEMPAVAGESLREPILLIAACLAKDMPLPAKHLPVVFRIDRAPHASVLESITDGDGKAAFQIGAATLDMNGIFVRASVDIARLLAAEDMHALLKGFFERLTLPEAAVTLRVFSAAEREAFLWNWGFAGRRVAVYAGCAADGRIMPWNKMRDEISRVLAGAGASVVPGRASLEQAIGWSATPSVPWPCADDAGIDAILVAAARGRINRRESPSGPLGEECQFFGDIRTAAVASGCVTGFSDQYQGAGGWNPMGEQMTLDVLAIHAARRWQSAMLKHIGSK